MALPSTKTPKLTTLEDQIVLLYGPPKIGKSTFFADSDSTLFIATEPGLNNLDVYRVNVSNWDELLQACADLATTEHKFKSVVIDTIDNAYRFAEAYIYQKNGIVHESDMNYGKGWALVSNEFHRVITKLANLPIGLAFISHAKEDTIEPPNGAPKYTRMVTTLPAAPAKYVIGLADMLLFADIETSKDASTGQNVSRRVMRTRPNKHYLAGDRSGCLPPVVDLNYAEFAKAFKAGVKIKAASEAQEKEAKAAALAAASASASANANATTSTTAQATQTEPRKRATAA